MAKPEYLRPTVIADQDGRPLARFAPRGPDLAQLEIPGAPPLKLARRGSRVLGFAMVEWAGKGRKQRLWGAAEICAFAEVTPVTLRRWRERNDFPYPCAELACGPIWEEPVVRAWLKSRRPKMGRPEKPLTRRGTRR